MAAGAPMPDQVEFSKPGTPDSAMVGMPGSAETRFAEVTAIARTFPDWMCGRLGALMLNESWMCPAITSIRDCAEPR